MAIARPPYAPVGCCIYCGATRHSEFREKLGDEHIVPEGLNGTFVLPEASCGKCEGMTCSFEQFCQKPMLGAIRYQLGMRSKRPKDRPTTLPVHLMINGEWHKRQLPIADVPLVLFAPIFPPPGIFTHPDRPGHDEPLRFYQLDATSEEKRTEILGRYGATHMASEAKTRVDMWGRMIAKIAHSYATASYGLGNFRPFLLGTIRGDHDDDPTEYVGGERERPDLVNKLHDLKIGYRKFNGQTLLIVRIHLFASLGFPVYSCVAGALESPLAAEINS